MALLTVKTFGDPILKERSKKVEAIDMNIKTLSSGMARTMYEYRGIGLAAPQIGVLKQVIVIDMDEGNYVIYVNPVIDEASKKTDVEEEGCLCLPGVQIPVRRSKNVVVSALDLKGRPVQIEASDFLARVLQHEIDHLAGLSIVDRTDQENRRRAIQEFMEAQDQEA